LIFEYAIPKGTRGQGFKGSSEMLKALIKSLEKNPSILRPSSPTKLEKIHIIKNFILKGYKEN